MTTLNAYYADEIAAALQASLKDDGFVSLYKAAADVGAGRPIDAPKTEWWKKGPTAMAFKNEMDAAQTLAAAVATHNKYLAAGGPKSAEMVNEVGELNEPIDYSEAKRAVLQGKSADDTPCAHDGTTKCPQCADAQPGLAVAMNFAIKHMVKIADALDKAGFPQVANYLDVTVQHIADKRS